jgi:diacylglycerol kinase family enzyme
LPLGTANNTARSLGIEGDSRTIIAAWKDAEPTAYDLASIHANGGTPTTFSEAVGWGLFPDLMARTEKMPLPDRREDTLERDRKLFAEEIERAKLRAYEIEADGTLVRGEFLLLELVNIRLIGPQVELSPESNPGDGHFELVLAGEPERKALMELARGARGSDVGLPTRRVKQAVVRGGRGLHRDGTLVKLEARANEYSVTIDPASVQFLLAR